MKLVDGYAPFCKHLFVPNFTNAISSFMKITPENRQFLVSDYLKRRDGELPVLERWFDVSLMPEGAIGSHFKATYLDIILYSKGQIEKENEATG